MVDLKKDRLKQKKRKQNNKTKTKPGNFTALIYIPGLNGLVALVASHSHWLENIFAFPIVLPA